MARPREFDEQVVLDRALETFWSKGYDGTSVEDLVEATGLRRASLYGAFGDKEQLFTKVLDHYMAKADAMEAVPAASLPAREALSTLTSSWVLGMCPKDGPRGCFLSMAGTPAPARTSCATRCCASSPRDRSCSQRSSRAASRAAS